MSALFQLALAPILIVLAYIYIRDKYEKEPWRILVLGIFIGFLATIIIYFAGNMFEIIFPHKETPFLTAFISASFIEEGVKYILFMLIIWRNKNFNEPFDGIVYSVFITLAFAGIENFIYIFNPSLGGVDTAVYRAFISIPSHAHFGIQMGYFLGLAKFSFYNISAVSPSYNDNTKAKKIKFLSLAFIMPFLFHGLYDYFLFKEEKVFWILFWILEIIMWGLSFLYLKKLNIMSPFRKLSKERL